ncbi:MAG: hypothetical protein U1A78_02495 [Polyangia bacterium]
MGPARVVLPAALLAHGTAANVRLALGQPAPGLHPPSSARDAGRPSGARASDGTRSSDGAAPGTSSASPTSPAPGDQLARAKLAYQRGDYGAAVLLLRPLLYPQALLAQEEQLLFAHKLLALSYFFEHDEVGAEQEFNLLLSLKPDFQLDPVIDPLKAVAFLDDIRRRNEQRLQEIRRRQAEEEARQKAEQEALQKQAELLAQKQAKRVYIERTVQRRFSALHLLPFGVPQLAEKRRALGATLLVSEMITGGASLGCWIAVRLKYPDGTFAPRELTTARALTATYLTTGVTFWALVVTGLVDALLRARTVVQVRELGEPPRELVPGSPPSSPSSPPTSMLLPGAGAGGLTGLAGLADPTAFQLQLRLGF